MEKVSPRLQMILLGSQLYPSETLISSVTWHSNIYLNSIFTVHFCLYRRYLTWVFFFAEREINRKKNIIQRSKSTISLLYGAMWLLVSQWVPYILGYIFSYKTILAIFFPAVFFSIPVGAELPLYYTHKQGMNIVVTFALFLSLPGLKAK